MNVMAVYVIAKENVNKVTAEKTAELFFEGMKYEEAFEEAKKLSGNAESIMSKEN